MIANELQLDTEIPTKGRMTMSLNALLDSSKYAEKFVGGSALAIFLMPDNYHHYHSPTTGKIVESNESVGNRLFGMPDMLGVLNNGNPGYNMDYSVIENFKHGGSTVLLIFEKGKLNSMTVEQGQRIGKLKH